MDQESLIKTAIARIKQDALTIRDLSRWKEAAEVVFDLIAEGRLDPGDGQEKVATLISAEDFELEKRALLLELQDIVSTGLLGELTDTFDKEAEENLEEPLDVLIQDLMELNGIK